MVALPTPTSPTVDAIYAAYEAAADHGYREHLGASLIGAGCERAIWYSFRWATRAQHAGRLLRLFETGNLAEARFVAGLRRIGVTVLEVDPATGRQWKLRDASGHFGGSMDGLALGLGMMLANGTITPQMHEAGSIFRTLFRSAALDGIATSQLIRLASATTDATSSRQIDARKRVAEALDALGGHDSPAGSCVWFVVGLEMSLREWATRRGWSGKPVPQPTAGGMLVAALGILAVHFGLMHRQRAA